MNRFGGPRQAAPLAPMQQQRPGFLETTGTAIAGNEMMSAFKDPSAYADKLGFGTAGVDVAAADAASTMAAPAAEFSTAAAAPMAELGTAGIAEAGAGLGAEGLATAGMEAAATTGAATTGLAAAMPWVGAGLLAGKAFGLFSKGGPVYKADGGFASSYDGKFLTKSRQDLEDQNYDPYEGFGRKIEPWEKDNNEGGFSGMFNNLLNQVSNRPQGSHTYSLADLAKADGASYAACGGKMPKYRAEGGRSDEDDYRAAAEFYSKYYDRSNKPKYDNSPYYIGTPKTYLNELPRMDEKQIMTPAEYRAGGGPLYREEGGDTGGFWNYFKKSFTEKPAWEDYKAVQVPVLDGNGNPTNMTSTVYRPNPNAAPVAKRKPAPVEDRSVNLDKQIARDIYGEYDDGEDMGDASYLAGDPAPYSVQTYPLDRRGEIPMKSNMPSKGGPLLRKFGAAGIRRNPEEFNRDLNEYSINRNSRLNPQPDDGSGIWEDMKGFFKSMGSSNGDDADVSNFNMGGRVGPLKSVKYKSAGGSVSEQSYYNPYGK